MQSSYTDDDQQLRTELNGRHEALLDARIAIEKAHLRYKELYELAPVGYLTLSNTGLVAESNRTAATILGTAHDELLNRSFDRHVAAIDLSRWRSEFAAAWSEESKRTFRLTLKRHDDSFAEVIACCLRMPNQRNRPALLISLTDITENHETARTLLEEDALTRALRTLARETAIGMAHELNQPITAMASYVEVARMLGKDHKLPAHLLQAIEGMADEVQRSGKVLHQLMRFLHQPATTAEELDLAMLIDNTVKQAATGHFSDMRITLLPPPGLKAVRANRLQVEKALFNLLRNGFEAVAESAPENRRITIHIDADEQFARVSVHDMGPRLDEKVAQQLFKPLFSTKAHGMGMGLAVSRALIEGNGGRLWYERPGGPGSIFHFTLPLAD
jgi:PAS domain S-box-containing protein